MRKVFGVLHGKYAITFRLNRIQNCTYDPSKSLN